MSTGKKKLENKAPRPQAVPAEAWGRQARGGRLRGRGGVREVSLQPRNTKIMRREGPWGRAGWFRSRYLTLTDATAGRLERSCRHPPPLYSRPPHLPQARVDGGSGRPATGSPLPGVSKETSVYLPEARWRWGERVWRQ